jgi:hypothetical protein
LATTGPFARLDAELHLRIFRLLNQEDRLRCVFEVCKGWRTLRKDPALWRSVALCAPTFCGAGALAFVMGARSPLPSPACVQQLTVDGKQCFGGKVLETLLTALTHVTDASLQGRYLTPNLLALLAQPRAAQLERLALGSSNTPDEARAALLEVLSASPALTTLSLDTVADADWLAAAAAAASAACGGAPPPLRELLIDKGEGWGGYECGVHVRAMAHLGAAFPRLDTLALASLRVMGDPGAAAWAPLAALRTLRIRNLGDCPFEPRTTSSAQLQQLLRSLASAAPQLVTLELSRGEEARDLRGEHPGVAQLLPSVGAGAGGVFALRQLRTLKLSYVHIAAADADGADLPALREMWFLHCGSHAAAAAVALAAAAPALECLSLVGVIAAEQDGSAGPGVGALVALAHGALRSLRVFTTTPNFPCTARGTAAKAAAEAKAAKSLAREIKALAARKALPSLRQLTFGSGHDQPMPQCFAAAHPWPLLRALTLWSATPDSVATCLTGLRAPALAVLTLPGIEAGVAKAKTRLGYPKPPTKGVIAAYEALRTSGAAPLLPPLRMEGATDAA